MNSVRPRGVGMFERPAVHAPDEEGASEWLSPHADLSLDHPVDRNSDRASPVKLSDTAPSTPSSVPPDQQDTPPYRRRSPISALSQAQSPPPGATPPSDEQSRDENTPSFRVAGPFRRVGKGSLEASPGEPEPAQREDRAISHAADTTTPAPGRRRDSRLEARPAYPRPSARVSDRAPGETSAWDSSSSERAAPVVAPSMRTVEKGNPGNPALDRASRQDHPADSASTSEVATRDAATSSLFPRPHAPAPLESRRESPVGGGRPVVHVSIGRIEIRARSAPTHATQAPVASAPKAYRPAVTLDEYLKKRGGRT